MLALDARSVRLADAAPGDRRPLAGIVDLLRRGGVAAVSPNGVLGDPTGASAAEGRAVLGAWIHDLAAAVDRWATAVGPGRVEAGR
jgi:creatinine amidohydrolase